MAMSLSSTYTGVVRSVNEKGLKLEGHDSWLNVSRFAVGVILPERGETVTCTLDKSGFLRCVEVVGALPSPIAGGSDVVREADDIRAPQGAPLSTRTDKDRTITRLAVLKAAAEFSASKPSATSGDVLAVAASWEKWVNRDEDPTPPLVDAF